MIKEIFMHMYLLFQNRQINVHVNFLTSFKKKTEKCYAYKNE